MIIYLSKLFLNESYGNLGKQVRQMNMEIYDFNQEER